MEVKEIKKVEENSMRKLPRKPYKIMDYHGAKRIGIVAQSFSDLIERAHIKLDIPSDTPVRVVLEVDGTEVEDEDYFSTVESNTAFVILVEDQKWLPNININSRYRLALDEPDREEKPPPPHLVKLVDELYSDLTCITLLGGKELELLADMDTSYLADIIPEEDRAFLGTVKEASFRILNEKEDAKEAMELLKLYHYRHVGDRKKRNQEEKDE